VNFFFRNLSRLFRGFPAALAREENGSPEANISRCHLVTVVSNSSVDPDVYEEHQQALHKGIVQERLECLLKIKTSSLMLRME
jgi:hypothetical protein